MLEICPTPNPTLNLPNRVNKCKTEIKTHLLMQPCYLNFLICRFELFSRTVVTRDSNRKVLTTQVHLGTLWATKQTYRLWKPIDIKLDMCNNNVQKHQFSNLFWNQFYCLVFIYFGNCSDMYLLRISRLAKKCTQEHKCHETRWPKTV